LLELAWDKQVILTRVTQGKLNIETD
jgi:hypothetical protein